MKLLFTTDLHGDLKKYDSIFKTSQEKHVDIVVNSGDMLPNRSSRFQQNQFITQYLNKHFHQFEHAKIHYLCYLGNDDLKIFDPIFEETCQQYQYIHNIAQRKFKIQNFEFIGMNWVVDYPFRLKDRCRMDSTDYIFQQQFGKGLLSTENGWKEIEDWFDYANTIPTIAEELQHLPQPDNNKNAVYIMHMPPANLGLDVCGNGEKVGSKAIYHFLRLIQPRYSLHGHIHESPEVSGIWKASLGNTICIQPGQMRQFTYVIIDFEKNTVERFKE